MRLLVLVWVFLSVSYQLSAQTPFFPVYENEEWYFIDYSGNKVLKLKAQIAIAEPFSSISSKNPTKYAVAYDKSKGLFGYLNTKGEWTLPPIYKSAHPFREGYAVVQFPCDDKCLKEGNGLMNFGYSAVIDPSGKIVLKGQDQNPEPGYRYWFNGSNFNGLLCITQGLSVGEMKKLMTINGTVVSERFNEYGNRLSSGEWMATRSIDGLTYYNSVGQKMLQLKDHAFGNDFYSGYARVTKEILINDEQTPFTYFIDKTGKKAIEIPKEYDAHTASDIRSGMYAVKKESDNKFYYLNLQGKEMLGPYDEAFRFSHGLAPVLLENRYVFIDITGKIVIEPEGELKWYSFEDYQKEGYVFFTEGGNIKGVVLKNGKIFHLKDLAD